MKLFGMPSCSEMLQQDLLCRNWDVHPQNSRPYVKIQCLNSKISRFNSKLPGVICISKLWYFIFNILFICFLPKFVTFLTNYGLKIDMESYKRHYIVTKYKLVNVKEIYCYAVVRKCMRNRPTIFRLFLAFINSID